MAKLRYKYGTMNSSKSANLLMIRHNYIEQGKSVIIYKPSSDTRDGEFVQSRALDETAPAVLIGTDDVGFMYKQVAIERPNCVLVDEVQFFSEEQVEELGRIVDDLEIPVIAFGLLTDFQGHLFNGSRKLVEIGAVIEEIKTECHYCSKRATHNIRLLDGKPVFEGDQLQVGDKEYVPVCRKCYSNFKR